MKDSRAFFFGPRRTLFSSSSSPRRMHAAGGQEDVASRAAQVGRSPSGPRCNHATGGGRCEQDTANGPALAEITARVPVVVSIRGHQPVDHARRRR